VAVKVRLSGFRELDKALGELSKATGTRVLQRAGAKAMQPMADLAASLAPNDPQTPPLDLASSIVVSRRANAGRGGLQDFERGARATIHVGPSVALPRYARAIVQEFGSKAQSPQPYMRPAFEQDGSAVIDRLKPLIKAEIDKVVARAAARAAKVKG
jgi:HK97 gp10 family phage protein